MGALDNVVNLMYEVVNWGKLIAVPASAIAFSIGGLKLFFNGKDGFEKAKPWLMGAFVGLVVTLGANGFTQFLQNKITF